jgi:hypothetical protein
MSLELLGRVHKELSITGSALYEAILAISERVNRKVQIIRLHWQASMLLERMDRISGELGQQIVDQVSRRVLVRRHLDPSSGPLETTMETAAARVHELKQSLIHVDAHIRELKLEAIHHDLLHLQRDLSLRSAGIERITISRRAPAVGQPLSVLPRVHNVHIATILRGPFLLFPDDDLICRPDDIVVLIGLQSELDHLTTWFTAAKAPEATVSAPA